MNLNDQKIAYAPYSNKLNLPGDRRRFVFYANERKIKYEKANINELYDIVYVTYGSNLSAWITYKKKNPTVKIIFELIDSYLIQNDSLLTRFKGFIKFITGKENRFFFNYKSAITEMISLSDAVVCSSDIQKADILKFNKNVHVSLDYFSNDISHYKKDYKTNSKIKLVWEGQAYTAANLALLNEVLGNIKDDVEIYVITDPSASYYLNLYKVKTKKILKNLKFNYHFVPWQQENISKIIANCDLAVIPIIPGDTFSWNKPENKLLFFWEIGIPALTSNTPSYKRVMDIAGINLYCSSADEWIDKINYFSNSKDSFKKEIANISSKYIKKYHSKEVVLQKWDFIFESLEIVSN